MSVERENALGRQAAQEVEQSIGLVRDPELTTYVDALGQRLAQHSPRRDVSYRFYVADMPEPNAFALPGGYIYVSRGLLVIANSEAELANVIGHEIGHVAARHASQRETRSVGVGLLSALGTIVAGVAAGGQAAQAVSQLGQIAGAGLIASYGRDQERQADEVGQKLAAESGWDPGAVSHFFTTLERQTTLEHGEQLPSFLDSHPMTSERAQATAARARTLAVTPAAPVAATQAAFLARVRGSADRAGSRRRACSGARASCTPASSSRSTSRSGWQTQNAADAVGAISPQRDALVVLETQGPPGDPQRRRREVRAGERHRRSRTPRAGAWTACRRSTRCRGGRRRTGRSCSIFTWIAHPRVMLRLTGMSPQARYREPGGRLRRGRPQRLEAQRRRARRDPRAAPARRRSARGRDAGGALEPHPQRLEPGRDGDRERASARAAARGRPAREDRRRSPLSPLATREGAARLRARPGSGAVVGFRRDVATLPHAPGRRVHRAAARAAIRSPCSSTAAGSRAPRCRPSRGR